jgi:hypothetical protein
MMNNTNVQNLNMKYFVFQAIQKRQNLNKKLVNSAYPHYIICDILSFLCSVDIK